MCRFRFRIPPVCRVGTGRHSVSCNQKGFTLLELIIVIFLISLVLGLSAVFFANTLPSGRLNATVREMTAMIKYARSFASIKGEPQTVTIDLDAKRYGIEGRGYRKIPADINIMVIDTLEGEIYKGQYHFLFYGTGGVDAGSVILWNEKKKVNIHLDPVVGSVVVR